MNIFKRKNKTAESMKDLKVVELEARLEAEQRLVKYLIGMLNDKMEMNEVILN